MRPELKRIFQSFIGFLNIVGAMEGQAQFDMNMESENGMQFISATYVPEVDRKSSDEAPIHLTLARACLLGRDRRLVELHSTAKQLAAEVAKAPKDGQGSSAHDTMPGTKTNTLVDLDVQALKQILLDNRRQLVSQNVLEKGHSRKDAEKRSIRFFRFSNCRSQSLSLFICKQRSTRNNSHLGQVIRFLKPSGHPRVFHAAWEVQGLDVEEMTKMNAWDTNTPLDQIDPEDA